MQNSSILKGEQTYIKRYSPSPPPKKRKLHKGTRNQENNSKAVVSNLFSCFKFYWTINEYLITKFSLDVTQG